ncbi:hypothetical protein IWQ61_005533 [Dispira simplex]|nr:hypothetical protein IWQ61_005533 [Dispira simplex]
MVKYYGIVFIALVLIVTNGVAGQPIAIDLSKETSGEIGTLNVTISAKNMTDTTTRNADNEQPSIIPADIKAWSKIQMGNLMQVMDTKIRTTFGGFDFTQGPFFRKIN